MMPCPLCSADTRVFFRLAHTTVRKCRSQSCGLEFAADQISPRELQLAYRELYYPSDRGSGSVEYPETPNSVLEQVFVQLAGQIGEPIGRFLLDYGCGRGGLCRVARSKGFRVVGIEPDPSALESSRSIEGVQAFASLDALEAFDPELRFDVIFLWNVVEHLRKPWEVVAQLRELLARDGSIVIATMNTRCIRARVEGKKWENYANPTHFYYFDPRSLQRVVTASGFPQVVEWPINITYPGHGRIRRLAHSVLTHLGLADGLVRICRTGIEGETGPLQAEIGGRKQVAASQIL